MAQYAGCHKWIIYKVNVNNSVSTNSLLNRGANECIAGADTPIIFKNKHHKVDFQGINFHQMVGLSIGTAEAIVNTTDGIIAFLNQYTYTCRVTFIHLSEQVKSYKSIVDDHSMKVSGKQRIITSEQYIIPVDICNGLSCITM